MEIKKIRCDDCGEKLPENIFYKNITQKLNYKLGKYEPWIACKKCIMSDLMNYKSDNFEDILIHICRKYNLYYDINIIDTIQKDSYDRMFSIYIKNINSLAQYKDKKHKDSVFYNDRKIGSFFEYVNVKEEKSDIEFINDDIKQLKKNIEKSIQKEDFNAHNKWMNCLRDAIELRDKLQGNKEYVINIGTVTVNKDNADEFLDSLIKLAKDKSSILS
jgi:hypothetical protein